MTDAWFAQSFGSWFSLFSLLALFSLLRPLADRGQRRGLVLFLFGVCIFVGTVLLLSGVVAASSGQPSFVVRPLLLSGFVVTSLFVGAFVKLRQAYVDADIRRTIASDL